MIQVYTGNGKGKTTAALGLAMRASGAGKKVYLCQFVKGKYYCELASLKKLKNIKVEQFGSGCFIRKKPQVKDIALAQKGFCQAKKSLNKFDLVILDEINVALSLGLVKLRDVVSLIKRCPKKTELVLTGRGAPDIIIKLADLVSEIKEKKHYFKKGVRARKGIEY